MRQKEFIHMQFRKAFIALVILAASVISAGAQEKPEQPASQSQSSGTFTPEQRRAAQEDLRSLGQLFGVTPQTQAQPNQPAKDSGAPSGGDHKTMGDVADRMVTLAAEATSKIMVNVEKAAPYVWTVFIRQQYVKAVNGLIVPFGMVFLTLAYMRIAKRYWTLTEDEAAEDLFDDRSNMTVKGGRGLITTLIPLVIIFFCTIWGLNRLSDSVGFMVNPSYYAVQDMLRMLLVPGTIVQ